MSIFFTLRFIIDLYPRSCILSVRIPSFWLWYSRFCVFRHDIDTWFVCLPVCAILLDAYDSPTCRLPSSLYRQLHLRRVDLVLPTGLSRHHQRYICIHLRILLGKNASDQIISKEDRWGIHRRMDLHHHHRGRDRLRPHPFQIHDLSCHRNYPCLVLLMVQDLGVSAWSGLDCEPNPVFIPREFKVPPSFIHSFGKIFPIPDSVTVAPIQFHILVLATFASLIAPFGGFFASGLKRAFKIKDFGHSIPGHGGLTDRMDCQFMMVFFVFKLKLILRDSLTICIIRALLPFDMSP